MKRKKERKLKICFAASSGGHYEQLMMLKPLMEEYDSFVVTEKTKYKTKAKGEKTYYLNQVNRKEKTFLFSMIINLLKSVKILTQANIKYLIRETRCNNLYRCIGDDSVMPYCKIM